MVAWSNPGTAASTAERASATVADEGTSQTVPPLKSMEKLRPRVASEMRPTRMTTPEMANHRFHRPQKSKDVSPRKRRWKALWPARGHLGLPGWLVGRPGPARRRGTGRR